MPCESRTLSKQLAIAVPGARAGRNGAASDPGPGRRPGSGAAKTPAGRAALPRAAGVATTHFGLHQTAVVYSAALAVLAAAAAGSFLFRRRSQTRRADPAAAQAGPNG